METTQSLLNHNWILVNSRHQLSAQLPFGRNKLRSHHELRLLILATIHAVLGFPEPNFCPPHEGPPYKKRGHTPKKGGDFTPTGTWELKSTASMLATKESTRRVYTH